ncbi:hypothetical protein [Streptomyces sp. M54]|uniref:hypothetical protein n=1 Tax=Streptomyces sp. M54 TaxID=2759525 RepID=UPI001A90C3F3|nr:hypothetical protein [Streptomyces sp. M54]QSS95406.1 hypothetical protein H3V39_33600 [Streptomyces sp. M54]
MHRDPAAVLTETFGERHQICPDSVLLSAPYFGIVLRCLWDEDLDRDEAVDFLHRAEAALLDDTPALFPPTAYSDRLAGNLPTWRSTPCDHEPQIEENEAGFPAFVFRRPSPAGWSRPGS